MEIRIVNWRRLGLASQDLLPFLTRAERDKALGFLREDDRVRSATGALLLRAALAERFGPAVPALSFNAYGKPFVPGVSFRFNLSHSGGLVVLAAAESEVGVDVEEVRPLDYGLFRGVFTAREAEMIEAAGDPLAAFYRVWTTREALAKWAGVGLSLFEMPARYTIRYDRNEIDWQGSVLRITGFIRDGHRLTAVHSPEEAVSVREIASVDALRETLP